MTHAEKILKAITFFGEHEAGRSIHFSRVSKQAKVPEKETKRQLRILSARKLITITTARGHLFAEPFIEEITQPAKQVRKPLIL